MPGARPRSNTFFEGDEIAAQRSAPVAMRL
jgi:hypothetical protein